MDNFGINLNELKKDSNSDIKDSLISKTARYNYFAKKLYKLMEDLNESKISNILENISNIDKELYMKLRPIFQNETGVEYFDEFYKSISFGEFSNSKMSLKLIKLLEIEALNLKNTKLDKNDLYEIILNYPKIRNIVIDNFAKELDRCSDQLEYNLYFFHIELELTSGQIITYKGYRYLENLLFLLEKLEVVSFKMINTNLKQEESLMLLNAFENNKILKKMKFVKSSMLIPDDYDCKINIESLYVCFDKKLNNFMHLNLIRKIILHNFINLKTIEFDGNSILRGNYDIHRDVGFCKSLLSLKSLIELKSSYLDDSRETGPSIFNDLLNNNSDTLQSVKMQNKEFSADNNADSILLANLSKIKNLTFLSLSLVIKTTYQYDYFRTFLKNRNNLKTLEMDLYFSFKNETKEKRGIHDLLSSLDCPNLSKLYLRSFIYHSTPDIITNPHEFLDNIFSKFKNLEELKIWNTLNFKNSEDSKLNSLNFENFEDSKFKFYDIMKELSENSKFKFYEKMKELNKLRIFEIEKMHFYKTEDLHLFFQSLFQLSSLESIKLELNVEDNFDFSFVDPFKLANLRSLDIIIFLNKFCQDLTQSVLASFNNVIKAISKSSPKLKILRINTDIFGYDIVEDFLLSFKALRELCFYRLYIGSDYLCNAMNSLSLLGQIDNLELDIFGQIDNLELDIYGRSVYKNLQDDQFSQIKFENSKFLTNLKYLKISNMSSYELKKKLHIF